MASVVCHLHAQAYRHDFAGNGIIFDALYSGRNAVIYNTLIRQVKWLADDCIAIAYNSKDGTTHYEILQRVNDEVPVLQKIAGLFMKF